MIFFVLLKVFRWNLQLLIDLAEVIDYVTNKERNCYDKKTYEESDKNKNVAP